MPDDDNVVMHMCATGTCSSPSINNCHQLLIGCCQRSVQSDIETYLYVWIYPCLLIISLFGNSANLALFAHRFLRDATTVRMLIIRALANILFTLVLAPNFIYALAHYRSVTNNANQSSSSVGYTTSNGDIIESFYWHSLKYSAFASNLLNTVSVWMTVTVAIESIALVGWPMSAKRWFDMRNTHVLIAAVISASVGLHALLIVQRTMIGPRICPVDARFVVYHYMSMSSPQIEHLYFVVTALLINICPLFILAACSIALARWLLCTSSGNLLSTGTVESIERKRCVVRLALATAVCHLVFEFPSAFVLVVASLSSSSSPTSDLMMRMMIATGNFLTICNASITFYLYLLCSRPFRRLSLLIYGRCTGWHRMPIDEQRLYEKEESRRYSSNQPMTTLRLLSAPIHQHRSNTSNSSRTSISKD